MRRFEYDSGPAETPNDWMRTSAPLSARFTARMAIVMCTAVPQDGRVA